MEVIMMESAVFRTIMDKLTAIELYIVREKDEKMVKGLTWICNAEASKLLNVSLRTLQRYRSNGVLPYTIRGNKTYYPLAGIMKFI